jgi:predicted  nucleic acid-binding Zn-ribbon protein
MERTPAVSCTGCGFHWNSAAMAEGLRLLGSCPKCGGVLSFGTEAPAPPTAGRTARAEADAPHLVLGIPRR